MVDTKVTEAALGEIPRRSTDNKSYWYWWGWCHSVNDVDGWSPNDPTWREVLHAEGKMAESITAYRMGFEDAKG